MRRKTWPFWPGSSISGRGDVCARSAYTAVAMGIYWPVYQRKGGGLSCFARGPPASAPRMPGQNKYRFLTALYLVRADHAERAGSGTDPEDPARRSPGSLSGSSPLDRKEDQQREAPKISGRPFSAAGISGLARRPGCLAFLFGRKCSEMERNQRKSPGFVYTNVHGLCKIRSRKELIL